jgi:hypothetical protein
MQQDFSNDGVSHQYVNVLVHNNSVSEVGNTLIVKP